MMAEVRETLYIDPEVEHVFSRMLDEDGCPERDLSLAVFWQALNDIEQCLRLKIEGRSATSNAPNEDQLRIWLEWDDELHEYPYSLNALCAEVGANVHRARQILLARLDGIMLVVRPVLMGGHLCGDLNPLQRRLRLIEAGVIQSCGTA